MLPKSFDRLKAVFARGKTEAVDLVDNCIFCKIIRGEIPSYTIYEDERFKAILDISPATEGHAVIIPKKHYKNLFDLPEDYCAGLLPLAKKLSGNIISSTNAAGVNILQNNGAEAGQTVFHFHMHIIPRYDGDNVRLQWDATSEKREKLEIIKNKIIEARNLY